jgi:RimJ/RimL family protein N-acetyltransferase
MIKSFLLLFFKKEVLPSFMHLSAEIPTLTTARLRLRAPRLNDFPHCMAMWTDADVVRHLSGKSNTREEVWTRLLRFIGHWCALGYGYWVAESIGEAAFIGVVGFGDFRRDLVPSLDDLPEMGWVLTRAAHGQGLATEAGRAALSWRDRVLPPGQTVCIIDAANAASFRVAAKLGFRQTETTTYQGKGTAVLRRNGPS